MTKPMSESEADLESRTKGSFLTMDEYKAAQPDPIILISDLSHQLEEARGQIETLTAVNRELSQMTIRAEGARDAIKDLLMELWNRK